MFTKNHDVRCTTVNVRWQEIRRIKLMGKDNKNKISVRRSFKDKIESDETYSKKLH